MNTRHAVTGLDLENWVVPQSGRLLMSVLKDKLQVAWGSGKGPKFGGFWKQMDLAQKRTVHLPEKVSSVT